ncbi:MULTISPECIES: hypothetical protein [unclassified Legionella]|uniref:hypothetical protein n=1 Tax=unclassified Legionella TaxID=2622702 RepID=UPI0010545D53|nr:MULTISPECIES: hypothetical protein [unclassified Legionella]MDI9818698.1 hypothetical protein [Legionella sp. PL877]
MPDIKQPLEHIINNIQKRIEVDLVIGSGNVKSDLIKTQFWSGEALDHARMKVVYEKQTKDSKSSYQHKTSLLKKAPDLSQKNPLFQYAIFGSNGLLARAGNCQEFVGLAIYYLIQHPKFSKFEIEVMEMPDCFDHVLLRISDGKTTVYYDPWMKISYPEELYPIKIKETKNRIIENLEYERKQAKDDDESEEISGMISQCKQESEIKLSKGGSLNYQQFKDYCKLFIEQYSYGLKENYPGFSLN